MSELVGASIELSIREMLVFEDHRNSIRCFFNLSFKQFMSLLVLRIGALGLVPLNQKLMLLGFTEQRQFTYALLWVRHNPFEQSHKMTDNALDCHRIEQINCTDYVTMKTLVLLFHVQFEVEAGYARIDLQLLHFQTPQPKRACFPMPQSKRSLKER